MPTDYAADIKLGQTTEEEEESMTTESLSGRDGWRETRSKANKPKFNTEHSQQCPLDLHGQIMTTTFRATCGVQKAAGTKPNPSKRFVK